MKKKISNPTFNKFTNNKIILYVVASIALLSLFGHLMYSEFSAIILFFIVGGVAYSVTKNMTIVLGTAFIVTSLATLSSSLLVTKEGMKEKNTEGYKEGGPDEPDEKGRTGKTKPKPKHKSDTKEDTKKDTKKDTKENDADPFSPLTPALFNNIPNKQQMQKQLGEATEMEQAYDNLEKIMGKENIQSISTDTKDLIKQQNELIKQLKTMTPALNDAMSSIGNLDLSKLTNMFTSATKSLSDLKTS